MRREEWRRSGEERGGKMSGEEQRKRGEGRKREEKA